MFPGLKHLRVLNAAHNKVSDLSKLEGCVKLEKLLLQDNEVMSLDSLPSNLQSLRQLTLRDEEGTNPVYEDASFDSPEAVDMSLLKILEERCPNVFLFNGGHTVCSLKCIGVCLCCESLSPHPATGQCPLDFRKVSCRSAVGFSRP